MKEVEISGGIMTGPTRNASPGFALAIHGGAGTLRRGLMDEARGALYRAGLQASLAAGHDVLAGGGSALDAVSAAVLVLEDDPLFQCRARRQFHQQRHDRDGCRGHGRARTPRRRGRRHLWPKKPGSGGACHSPHVLLAGEGALAFCRSQGLAFAERDYFYTESRWQALQHILERRRRGLPDTDPEEDDALGHGTVGAVARDRDGNLAAATSTGGIAGKLPGRIGDSPIIGAGTYADNASCAVSATGHGEIFMRFGAAFEIAARMRHRGQTLAEAAREVVEGLAKAGGSGGLVAVDRDGALALPFNCAGMYRGYVTADGIINTAIYDEPYRSA
jgi:L-asparaginase / beta-aspartyl-peptidase